MHFGHQGYFTDSEEAEIMKTQSPDSTVQGFFICLIYQH